MIISLKVYFNGKWKKIKNIKELKDGKFDAVHIVEHLTKEEFEKCKNRYDNHK